MLAAQATNLNEVQKKKRQTNPDPSNEWTIPLVKFLRELFTRMKDTVNHPQAHQQQQPAVTVATIESFMTNDNANSILLSNNNYLTEDKIKNLWDYATKLMRYAFSLIFLFHFSISWFFCSKYKSFFAIRVAITTSRLLLL